LSSELNQEDGSDDRGRVEHRSVEVRRKRTKELAVLAPAAGHSGYGGCKMSLEGRN
jgi:hypothetical protein